MFNSNRKTSIKNTWIICICYAYCKQCTSESPVNRQKFILAARIFLTWMYHVSARNACIWNTIGTIFYVPSVAVKWGHAELRRDNIERNHTGCHAFILTSLQLWLVHQPLLHIYKAAGYLRSSETHGQFVGTGRRNHEQNLDQRGLTRRPRRALGYLWTLAGPDFPVLSSFSPESLGLWGWLFVGTTQG